MKLLKDIKLKVMTSPFVPLVAVVCNLFIAYIIYFVSRIAFYLENYRDCRARH